MNSDDELSTRYRDLPQEAPSAELDARILAAAQAEPRRRPLWPKLAAAAAVVVLSIGVVTRIDLDPPLNESSAPQTRTEAETADAAESLGSGAAESIQAEPGKTGAAPAAERQGRPRASQAAGLPTAADAVPDELALSSEREAGREEIALPARRQAVPNLETREAAATAPPVEAPPPLCLERQSARRWWSCIEALRDAENPGLEAEIEAYRAVHGDPPATP